MVMLCNHHQIRNLPLDFGLIMGLIHSLADHLLLTRSRSPLLYRNIDKVGD